jgi:hypothetical protein
LRDKKNRLLLFYLDIPFILSEEGRFLLLVLLATNSTRVIYLHTLRSDYLSATNLLDLSLSLDVPDGLRDKLQTLSIFVFILYQMDKPSGICIVSPKHQSSRLTLSRGFALNSFILLFFLFCFKARCVCVVLDFWMHFIYKCVIGVFWILCRGGG